MAVTVDQASLGTGVAASSGVPATFNTTAAVAPGGMLVVLASRFHNAGTATLTASVGGGIGAMTAAHNVSSGSLRIYLFYVFCPAGLAAGTAVTVTSSFPLATDTTMCGASYLGVDTSGTVTAFGGAAAATAAWASGSVAGNSGDALIGGAGGDGTLRTSTPTSPAVERVDFNSAGTSGSVTLVDKLSIAGSDSLAGTWSGTLTHIGIGVAFKAAAGGTPDQNITDAGAIGSGQAIGSHTLTPGAVTVSPAGIGTAEGFGTARLDLNVTGAGAVASGEAIGAQTLTPGPVTVSPGGIASAEAVGSPVIGQGVAGAGGIASGEAFGAATITPGPVTVTASGITSGEAFGQATLSGGVAGSSPRQLPTLGAG